MRFFGKNPSIEKQKAYTKLANYKKGRWQNPNQASFRPQDVPVLKVLAEMIKGQAPTRPPRPVPSIKNDLKNIDTAKPIVVWFGHSSYLLSYQGINILVDPVFSGHASPFSFVIKAFPGTDIYRPEDMPKIDVLVITHDHYDHLDMATVIKLKSVVKKVVTPLGVGSHLQYWGYDRSIIQELNWYESIEVEKDLQFTATPAQHMSGRGMGFQKTLWASFVLQFKEYRFFIGGDSGYGRHLRKIGEKFGPFDLAFLENGQYNKHWRIIHELPEEVAQAAREMKVKMIFPVHWAKFRLALHAWNEPIKRLLAVADKMHLPVTAPKIGQPYLVGNKPLREEWWEL